LQYVLWLYQSDDRFIIKHYICVKNNLKLLLEDEKNDIEMINCMPTKTTIIRSPYPNVKLQVSIYRLIQKKNLNALATLFLVRFQ
jgi:hypothetical protein